MAFQKGENPHHPQPGSTIKVEPIRDKKAIKRIKTLLADHPRNYCLFVLGINTAYRANELLSLTVRQVRGLEVGDVLDIKQRKTRKYRPVTLNRSAISAIQTLVTSREVAEDDWLFTGQRGHLTTSTVSTMVKTWCKNAGLRGNYGSHTLRKTWGYWQRMDRGTAVPLLMEAFGHATQQQTLSYLGIQADEIAEIYNLEL
ncbi:MAG: tyrosine-type recombinase/integrase [Cyanobacteria bacterium P01_C01_bin.121]